MWWSPSRTIYAQHTPHEVGIKLGILLALQPNRNIISVYLKNLFKLPNVISTFILDTFAFGFVLEEDKAASSRKKQLNFHRNNKHVNR
jgi:hypothetical protein